SLEARNAFIRNAIKSTVGRLHDLNKEVVLILPFPFFNKPIAKHVIHHLQYGSALDSSIAHEAYEKMARSGIRDLIIDAATSAGAKFIDPMQVLCNAESCPYHRGLVSRYKDRSHISVETALDFRDAIAAMLMQDSHTP